MRGKKITYIMKLTYSKSHVSEEEINAVGKQLSPYAEHLKEVLQHGYED